jgi:CheY-like chemotaxis protein
MEKIPKASIQNITQPGDAPEPLPVAPCKPAYDFSGKTVLAVDDVAFNLTMIGMFFKKTNAEMIYATNGKEALDICLSEQQVDIVLMDIQMPVMNGLDATIEIKKHKPEIPIVAITAYVHTADRLRCFEVGCDDFLLKPCSRADMLLMVHKFFQISLPSKAEIGNLIPQ